ncbi:MAG: UDP-N-acetylmuramoyl-tripeptide--D-alanyl-D-alanine ligase [Candidatus Omnitrophica bacterium]|nr:UDP-N-acetylmuramoyl-tripeptide--D-alanyl-D-alanine ligase [Candidatus Omnitrophota bacterium]
MLTIYELQKITKGKIDQGDAAATVTGVSINSRIIRRGNVFIAIKGARFDGHQFIPKAIRHGARAVIVSKKVRCPRDIAVVRVKDTTKALGQIAAWHRARFDIPVIAITGSTGKTTTKEMVASVLQKKFRVLKNAGTENNQFGVPLTLLRLKSFHQAAVLELGTNQPGDIRWLAKIAGPTMAVFTNIGESHLEKLKSPAGVFREKAQLIKYVEPGGVIFVNGDDSYLAPLSKASIKHRAVRFGCGHNVDHKASRIRIMGNRCLHFKIQHHLVKINSPAVHNVYNALAAISCGLAFKIRYNDIIVALSRFQFRRGRQEINKIGPFWLIDDTYNANPVSFTSAINTLDALHIQGKRIVVCADMLELGPRSAAFHRAAGAMIGRSNTDVVLTIGRCSRFITEEAKRFKSKIVARHCKDMKDVQRHLKTFCRPGDGILIKGSRAMHMERAVVYFKEYCHLKFLN